MESLSRQTLFCIFSRLHCTDSFLVAQIKLSINALIPSLPGSPHSNSQFLHFSPNEPIIDTKPDLITNIDIHNKILILGP